MQIYTNRYRICLHDIPVKTGCFEPIGRYLRNRWDDMGSHPNDVQDLPDPGRPSYQSLTDNWSMGLRIGARDGHS